MVTAADTIADFTRGSDRISLSALGDATTGALTFVGTDSFTAVGQVRIVVVGTDVIVEINTVGTADADMAIRITGAGMLTTGDFLL